MTAVLVTGSASGIGAAVRARLVADGVEVIGVDLHDADIEADLSTADGRRAVVDAAPALCGAVMCAGLAALTGRPPSLLVSVNYFGATALLSDLRPKLSRPSSAVLVSSNSIAIQPGWSPDLVKVLLDGTEQEARELADSLEPLGVYPATKAALARWMRRHASVWIRQGIRLNAIAPGFITTALSQGVSDDPTYGPLMGALDIPSGRPGNPAEVADAIAFLLSDRADYVVGSTLFIDGGLEASLRTDDWPQPWQL